MNGHTNGHTELPLPSAKPIVISERLTLQPPLSRRGHGPGLVLLVPNGIDLSPSDRTIDPPPLQKWAEEGFAIAQIELTANLSSGSFKESLTQAMKALSQLEECDSVDKLGLICRFPHSVC